MRVKPCGGVTAIALAAVFFPLWCVAHACASVPAATSQLYQATFSATDYGQIPAGWRDLLAYRPSRAWAADDGGFLRVMLKKYAGLLVYDGAVAAGSANQLSDVTVSAELKKTEDEEVAFGIVCRLQDAANYYHARFSGDHLLEMFKVTEGQAAPIASLVASRRYRDGEVWRMSVTMRGPIITAILTDARGEEVARVDARDDTFRAGRVGLRCTAFATAKSFALSSLEPVAAELSQQEINARNWSAAAALPAYPVVRPVGAARHGEIVTPFENLAEKYDVIVAGGGTGGFGAVVQAARLGARVLLLEETDFIGGQMSAAAVTTMDESSCYAQFPVRERGIYREFNESMVAYYYSRDKDPFVAYYAGGTFGQQTEGGYEPRVTRDVLYGLIAETRCRVGAKGAKPILDLSLRTKVAKVAKSGDTVTGVTIAFTGEDGAKRSRDVACKVLIDATEYGDVIPLTGARYRVGNVTSDKLDPKALVQDYTWSAVIREYPHGLPAHLKVLAPPPGYETSGLKRYAKFQRYGLELYGAAGKGIKGPRTFRVLVAWRGMADTASPLTGTRSEFRHTRGGLNGGNDYPVTVATVEEAEQRRADAREGIYKTLSCIYYLQHELGLNWGLAEDEGYATPFNRRQMAEIGVREDLRDVAAHMPQMPYVRESRRIIGVKTLVAADLTRYEDAKFFPTSVAMGDYFMDLEHGKTADAVETDLDNAGTPKGSGPFQVPFEVFIPEKVDGFLPAEKNFSQSRVASGATRLQPVTMLTGQAAGTIAALAVMQGVQPRQLKPLQVQATLLDSGSTLVQRWYADVPWGTDIWRATQLLTLAGVMDRPGPINKDSSMLGSKARWGVSAPLSGDEMSGALHRLAQLANGTVPQTAEAGKTVTWMQLRAAMESINPAWAAHADARPDAANVTAGEFALIAAKVVRGIR
jgi:hypothetical protein